MGEENSGEEQKGGELGEQGVRIKGGRMAEKGSVYVDTVLCSTRWKPSPDCTSCWL